MLLLFIAMQWPWFDLETLLETTWVNTAPSPDRTKGFHETLFNSDLSHHVLIPFCVALQCCLLFLLLFFRVWDLLQGIPQILREVQTVVHFNLWKTLDSSTLNHYSLVFKQKQRATFWNTLSVVNWYGTCPWKALWISDMAWAVFSQNCSRVV